MSLSGRKVAVSGPVASPSAPVARRARPLVAAAGAVAALLVGAVAAQNPPAERVASSGIAGLYEQARRAYASPSPTDDDQAVQAFINGGQEAVDYLVTLAAGQADRVRTAEDIELTGLRMTMILLGRMNSYPDARAALERLEAHPVGEVGRWATFQLSRAPQTRPARTEPGWTTAPATGPGPDRGGARIEGDRIVTSEGWFRRPKVERPKLPDKVTRAFVIPIREEITSKTYDAIRRKALRCRTGGAELIVIDMDTWGGVLLPALDISRLLKESLDDIYTVCYVRTRAVSAGALIALACDEIVVGPVGKFGDCAPIVPGMNLAPAEREKGETVVRQEFEESATLNGYDPALAVSMVSYDREVWKLRNRRTRELRYGLRRDWRGRVSIPPGVATSPSDPRSEWELLEVVVHQGELLTMSPDDAVKLGFASRTIKPGRSDPLEPLMQAFGVQAEPVTLTDNWSERLVAFLTHPAVRGFLVFVMLLCAFSEMYTPGFGAMGTVAIICLVVLLGSSYLSGLALWWEIALFVLGVLLLAAEIFLIPGFGVAGILGIIFIVVGLVAWAVPNAPDKPPIPRTALDWSVFENGLMALILGFSAAVVAALAVSRYLPKVPLASKLFLPPADRAVGGAVAAGSPLERIGPGSEGVVEGPCRPVGKVRFGEDLLDAVTEGAMIARGATVRVLRREGNRVVVEEVPRGPGSPHGPAVEPQT